MKKLVSILAVAALLAPSGGVYAQKTGLSRAELQKKAAYNEEVLRPKIEKFDHPYNLILFDLLNGTPSMIVQLTGMNAPPELTEQFMQLAKEVAKHSGSPELAKKVVAHFVARMGGNKEKIARAYKEANNLFSEMSGTPIRK